MSHAGLRSVICAGETMAQLTPAPPANLSSATQLTLSAAGAESTVAMYLARLGVPTSWVSRVGADPFGRRIARMVEHFDVETESLHEDPSRPTGVYFKDPRGDHTAVFYYRTGSAASALCTTDFPWDRLSETTLVHTTGITAVLSPSTRELVDRLLATRAIYHHKVSLDVNYRPSLWAGRNAPTELLELAQASDIVFVGLDEAQALWGTKTDEQVRDLLPQTPELKVKNAEIGASVFNEDGRTFERAEKVDVVESVGAGDSFAAGYLYQLIHGAETSARIVFGHRLAAKVLRTTSDFVDPKNRA